MEALLVLGTLAGGTWWLGKSLFQATRSASRRRQYRQANRRAAVERQHLELLHRRRQQDQKRRRLRGLNQKFRGLQIALMQLSQAPDFQRAASRAEAANAVALSVRQRQYRRFRPHLVRHFARRLRAGTDAQTLLDSLTSLVEALGVASFEASYIQQEATRQVQNRIRPTTENFSASLDRLQQEHTDRTEALNQASLDPDTRQQLIEAQNQRLVESLMAMTVGEQGDTP